MGVVPHAGYTAPHSATAMKRRRLISVAIVFLIVIISAPFVLSWAETTHLFWPDEKFEPSRWRSTAHEERYRYFNDLKSSRRLNGVAGSDVVALLGEPDKKAPDGRYLEYMLKSGERDRFSFNAVYFMRVLVDTSGKVTGLTLGAD